MMVRTSLPEEPRSAGLVWIDPGRDQRGCHFAGPLGRQAEPAPGDVDELGHARVVGSARAAPAAATVASMPIAARIASKSAPSDHCGLTRPWNVRQRSFSESADGSIVVSTTTSRRACLVSAARNGCEVGNVVKHVMAGDHVGGGHRAAPPAARCRAPVAARARARRLAHQQVEHRLAASRPRSARSSRGASGRQAAPAPEPMSSTLPGRVERRPGPLKGGAGRLRAQLVGSPGEDLRRQHPG